MTNLTRNVDWASASSYSLLWKISPS